MPAPLVTIIIRCYNLAAYLPQAIESALDQQYGNVEVLIVDDGSTDESPAVARRFGSQVRYLRLDHGGVSAAGNAGLAAARGEFVAFLDADDWLLPEMVPEVLSCLAEDPEAGGARCGWIYTDPEGQDMSWRTPATANGDAFNELAHGIPFPSNSLVLRRSVLAPFNGFDVSLEACEDWDLWLRLARAGVRVRILARPLAVVRMRRVSTSRDPERALAAGLEVLRRSHLPDPRVPNPVPAYRNGCPCDGQAAAWEWRKGCVALALAQGRVDPALRLVETAEPAAASHLTPVELSALYQGLAYGCAVPLGQPALWPKAGKSLLQFLLRLEDQFHQPGLAALTMFEMAERFRLPHPTDLERFTAAGLLRHLGGRLRRRLSRSTRAP